MKKDIQKPILYKADPDLFVMIEELKDTVAWRFNRNKFLNDAVRLYVEFVKLMQSSEYAYLDEVSFNDEYLQRILYKRLRQISQYYRTKSKYK